jgi:hypothetical protein
VNTKYTTVFRGIRGELPEAFWLKDDFGDVTATDFAFMSTSVDIEVCKHYMDTKQHNVLWEVHCSDETTEGFHSGADVSMLSQYPEENEMLFPPLTMLKVVEVESVEVEEQEVAGAGVEDGPEITADTAKFLDHHAKWKTSPETATFTSVAKMVTLAAKSKTLRDMLTQKQQARESNGEEVRFKHANGCMVAYTRVVVMPVFV